MSSYHQIRAGTGEKMQYLVHEYNDNTIRFVLRYPAPLHADVLCRATRAVAESVDVLHASFVPGRMLAHWQIHDALADSDFFTALSVSGDPYDAALEEALLPVLPDARAQLHCTLFTGENACAIALRVSHLCADGADSKYLLGKLAEAYNSIAVHGDLRSFSVKNGSRAPEQVYQSLTRAQYRSLLRSPLSGIKTIYRFPSSEPGEKRITVRRLSAELMTQVHAHAKECGATLNDVLLAAAYRAYAALPQVDAHAPMSIMSMMDLRRHCPCGDSAGLANITGSLPTALSEGVTGDFQTTLAQITTQTHALKSDPLAGLTGMPLLHMAVRRTPFKLLLGVVSRVYSSMSMGMTNLGSLDSNVLTLEGTAPDLALMSGPLKKKPALQICVSSFYGECTLSVIGQYSAQDALAIADLLARLEAEMKSFA